MSEPLWQLSAVELAEGIRRRDYSSVEVTRSVLERIAEANPHLNAIVYDYGEEALQAADAGDGSTLLSISEAGWRTDKDGLRGSHDNCGGWTHIAMCMKAWLEHGIDLR